MQIIYTKHALDRMQKRFIKREWIEKAIEKPGKIIETKYGRKQAIKIINSHKISVVYIEENNNPLLLRLFGVNDFGNKL